MSHMTKTFIASASELQSSDLYMTIKATLFTVPGANQNGVRCTAEFMDEIVEHQDKYIGLPLCADTVNLVQGRYTKLGHCYNPKTGIYSSSIIGSFYRFEKEELGNGEAALVGYARVMKRNKRVCKAIGELFAEGALKFSFEISCGTYQTLEDDTILIDAADNNFIEGMCIVSFPACPEAIALELVAEINGIGKEADEMIDPIESAEVAAEVEAVEPKPVEATTQNAEQTAEQPEGTEQSEAMVAETEETEKDPAQPQDVVAEMEHTDVSAEETVSEDTEAQNAEVYVTTTVETREQVDVYDNDTGVSMTEVSIHEIRTHEKVEEAAPVAEAEEHQASEQAQTEEMSEPDAPDYAKLIAELQNMVEALRNELNEIRTERIAAEEKKHDAGEMLNPFIAEISAPKKYSLLESDKISGYGDGYSLLEKA